MYKLGVVYLRKDKKPEFLINMPDLYEYDFRHLFRKEVDEDFLSRCWLCIHGKDYLDHRTNGLLWQYLEEGTGLEYTAGREQRIIFIAKKFLITEEVKRNGLAYSNVYVASIEDIKNKEGLVYVHIEHIYDVEELINDR